MANKTYLELASELVTAMIMKGQIRTNAPRDARQWKDINREAVHTVGWALLEMYRELSEIPQKARQPTQSTKPTLIRAS